MESAISRRKFMGASAATAAFLAGPGRFVTHAQDMPTVGVGSMMFTESITFADGEGMEPAEIARGFLEDQGVI